MTNRTTAQDTPRQTATTVMHVLINPYEKTRLRIAAADELLEMALNGPNQEFALLQGEVKAHIPELMAMQTGKQSTDLRIRTDLFMHAVEMRVRTGDAVPQAGPASLDTAPAQTANEAGQSVYGAALDRLNRITASLLLTPLNVFFSPIWESRLAENSVAKNADLDDRSTLFGPATPHVLLTLANAKEAQMVDGVLAHYGITHLPISSDPYAIRIEQMHLSEITEARATKIEQALPLALDALEGSAKAFGLKLVPNLPDLAKWKLTGTNKDRPASLVLSSAAVDTLDRYADALSSAGVAFERVDGALHGITQLSVSPLTLFTLDPKRVWSIAPAPSGTADDDRHIPASETTIPFSTRNNQRPDTPGF